MNTLNYITAGLKNSPYVLSIDCCGEMRVAEMASIICTPTANALNFRSERKGEKEKRHKFREVHLISSFSYQKLISDKEPSPKNSLCVPLLSLFCIKIVILVVECLFICGLPDASAGGLYDENSGK